MFHDFMIVVSILFIHEIGHIVTAIAYKWKIHKIHVLPFGGNIEFQHLINSSIKEELLILLSGSFFQIIYYGIVVLFYQFHFIPSSLYFMFKNYHYSLLIFNLLPIYPLDGFKLMRCIFASLIPFKKALQYTIYLSFLSLLFALFLINQFDYSASYYVILIFIFYKLLIESKSIPSTFYKFLMERMLYSFSFQKRTMIDGMQLNKMRKGHSHIFKINDLYLTEKSILKQWMKRVKVDK